MGKISSRVALSIFLIFLRTRRRFFFVSLTRDDFGDSTGRVARFNAHGIIHFREVAEFPRESGSKVSRAYRSHRAARSISISRQMSNRSVTCIHAGHVCCTHTHVHTHTGHTHTWVRAHAYVSTRPRVYTHARNPQRDY